MVWYSHLFKDFLQVVFIHTIQGFGIVNKAEVDFFFFFLELSWFFNDPIDILNLISGSSAFFKIQLEHLEVPSSCTVEAWLGEL